MSDEFRKKLSDRWFSFKIYVISIFNKSLANQLVKQRAELEGKTAFQKAQERMSETWRKVPMSSSKGTYVHDMGTYQGRNIPNHSDELLAELQEKLGQWPENR